MSWRGTGTETMSSIEPLERGCARWVSAYTAAIVTTTAIQIATMPAGGRLLRAVPYSSPISKSVCRSGELSGAGGGGVGDGLDMATSNRTDCTRKVQPAVYCGHACFIASANFCTGKVLSTSFA